MQYRAELIDQYDILHSIYPSIKIIEEQLSRSFTNDEKKQLALDNYSMIKSIHDEKSKHFDENTQDIVPITTSLRESIQNIRDTNLSDSIKQIEAEVGRTLTEQELLMVENGDILGLEQAFYQQIIGPSLVSFVFN